MSGGKFGHGFFAAGAVAGLKGPNSDFRIGTKPSLKFARLAIAGVVGGTVSELTGGKFRNGALTGAMTHLFNAENAIARENSQKEQESRPQQCGAGSVTCKANGTGGATAPSDHPRWPGKGYTDDGRKIALYSCSNSGGNCSFHAPSNGENVLGAVLKTTVTPSGDLATYADRIESFTVDPSPGFLEKYLGIGPSDFVEELRKNQKAE